MKPIRALLLAGAVTAGAAAVAGYAHAGQDGMRTLILQWPGGGMEQVQAMAVSPSPQPVVLIPAPAVMPVPVALLVPDAPPAAVMPGDPFAQIDRISALMNAQAAAMMSAMNAMMAPPVVPAMGTLPPGGSASYAFVSSASGSSGACMESVQITMGAPGQAPQVVSHRSGNCGAPALPFGGTPAAAPVPQAPAVTPALVPAVQAQPVPAAPPAPPLIRARAELPVTLPQPSRT